MKDNKGKAPKVDKSTVDVNNTASHPVSVTEMVEWWDNDFIPDVEKTIMLGFFDYEMIKAIRQKLTEMPTVEELQKRAPKTPTEREARQKMLDEKKVSRDTVFDLILANSVDGIAKILNKLGIEIEEA